MLSFIQYLELFTYLTFPGIAKVGPLTAVTVWRYYNPTRHGFDSREKNFLSKIYALCSSLIRIGLPL